MLTFNKTLINPNNWVDHFFDEFDRGWSKERAGFVPSVDITEEKEAFTLRVELPGVAKENLNVEVKENRLILSGHKEAKAQGEDAKFRYVESRYGSFSRTFELPRNVKSDAIAAEFKEGVLQLRIPKVDEAKSKGIEIR